MNGYASIRNNRGITLISFILVLCVAGFFASIAMALWGPYYEYRNVVSAMKSVANEPGADTQDITVLQRNLQRRFDVGYVDNVDSKLLELQSVKGVQNIHIHYEVRKHYAANVDFLMTFDYSVPLESKASGDNE